MECFGCSGEGKVITTEWNEEWDRHDRNSPSTYDTNQWVARSGIEKYATCQVCKGTKEVSVLSLGELEGKRIKTVKIRNEGLKDFNYILLRLEDDSFAKVLIKDILYGK
ncbi:hypothetical protein [Cohnella lupini]|uniref:Uncharacterized protein n=1 Tax=Cohnella lupini TaxID=1294267 RepID=A0A3D9HZ64_9BACL|nr:hypothetical protein [Cohnella lupini]RED54784.1 hypothetical protein DFP95_12140 [Cohnella lupini]